MEHLYTRKKCTRCTRVARRGGRSVRGAREPVWANSLRIVKDVTRFSSYKEQKRRASETARVLSRVRTKSDPSSEAKTHSEQSRKNTPSPLFFLPVREPGVNARPRPSSLPASPTDAGRAASDPDRRALRGGSETPVEGAAARPRGRRRSARAGLNPTIDTPARESFARSRRGAARARAVHPSEGRRWADR